MFHSKPPLRPGRIAHSGSRVPPCSICKAPHSAQAGRGDGGNEVSLIGKAGILHLAPLFQVLENTAFKETVLVMVLLGAGGWSRAFLTHTSAAVSCQNRSAHAWQLPAEEGSRAGLGPSDSFPLLHPPGKPVETEMLAWTKPELSEADEEVPLCRWCQPSSCR